MQPTAENAGAQMRCEAVTVGVAVSDARGLQAVAVRAGAAPLAVLPGSAMTARPRGFHAVVDADAQLPYGPLHIDIDIDLAGTRSIGWVPAGDETRVTLKSAWPHPSFAGRFLPLERQVGAQGFEARWQVSALATTVQQAAQDAAGLCNVQDVVTADAMYRPVETTTAACLDSFGVAFIDPVNGYVLSDRALKYGLLFIVLTFVGVGLAEVLRRLRVHPVQYLLVGCALTLFFLLLVSLAEHVSFGLAYFGASVGCCALLTFYGIHVLRGVRAGLGFGAALGALYATLYALLQLEQTALVIGALLLFAVLGAVMVATRRVDWYGVAKLTTSAPSTRPT